MSNIGYKYVLKPSWLINYRLFIGCCVIWAVCLQAAFSWNNPDFTVLKYLSLFTVQSNGFAAVVLMISALLHPVKKQQQHFIDSARGAALLYLAITCVYFSSFFVSQNELSMISSGWIGLILYWLMPLVFLIDFVQFPPQLSLSSVDAARWFIYPALYVLLSVIVGSSTSWYPYAFLNPDIEGISIVLQSLFWIALGIFPLAQAIVWGGNILAKRKRKED